MANFLKKVLFYISVLCTGSVYAQTAADGLEAMQLEDWDKAINVYAAMVKANPADQQALLNLGNAYLAKGDKGMAEANFKKAYEAKPDGAYALIANGRLALITDNMSTADTQFEKAWKAGKKDITAQRMIGESFLYYIPAGSKKPNLTRAEQDLKRAMAYSSKDFATLMALGYCYKEKPDGGLAAQHYEFAEALDPKSPLTKLMLAKVYRAGKQFDKATTYFDKAIALSPTYSPALRGKAEHFYFARKWEQARDAYQALIDNGTEVRIEDEMQLANSLFITKNYKKCSDLVEMIIKKDNSKVYLRRLNAYSLYETGDFGKSLDAMNEYFKVAPKDKVAGKDFMYVGQSMIKTKGDTLAAIANLKTALEMDTSLWLLNKEMGDLYYDRKMYCDATRPFSVYIDSIEKTDAGYLSYMYKLGQSHAYCKTDPDRYIKAEAVFKRYTEIKPSSHIGWLWAAKYAAKQDINPDSFPDRIDEFGKATMYYEKYVELAAADPVKNKKDLIDGYGYLAYKPFVKSDLPKAKAYVDKILAIDPGNEIYTQMLEIINTGGLPTTPTPPGTPTPPNGKEGGGKDNKGDKH